MAQKKTREYYPEIQGGSVLFMLLIRQSGDSLNKKKEKNNMENR